MTTDSTVLARKTRVNRFLQTCRFITQKSKNEAHLVFLTTFKQIHQLLDKVATDQNMDVWANVLTVEKVAGETKEYRLKVEGKPCYVILLDSAKNKSLEPDHPYTFDRQDERLILVTQFATASNGVNLEWSYIDKPDKQYDFQSIHLLEVPYYYLSADNFDSNELFSDEKPLATKRKFFWQVWKLAEAREISRRKLENILRKENISYVNGTEYPLTDDYLLNQIAAIEQVLGRIDRKRDMGHVSEVRLADTSSVDKIEYSVMSIIDDYLTRDGKIGQQRDSREAYTSDLILNVYEAVFRLKKQTRVKQQLEYEDISDIQNRCYQKIDDHLELHGQMREGIIDDEKICEQIKDSWSDIRIAMLRQDYQFETPKGRKFGRIKFRKSFVHSTAYLQPESKLNVDKRLTKIFPQGLGEKTFGLNWVYPKIVTSNGIIRRYFSTRDYHTHHIHTTADYIFVPYAIQTILAGAVGETILEALLKDGEGFTLEDPSKHASKLFELFDLKLAGYPVYFDAKSYSQQTIYRLNAEPDDEDFDRKLNAQKILERSLEKRQQIIAVTDETDTKYIIVNVRGDGGENQYWTDKGVETDSFDKSAVTVVSGVVDDQEPERLRPFFHKLLQELKEKYP